MSNLKEELNNYKDKKSSYKYIGLLIIVFVIAILITLSIEILQPIVGRSFDIDDIIMNFIGSIIGYLAVTIFIKLKETNK